jgi:Mrp family chromosome partitioning ATPase
MISCVELESRVAAEEKADSGRLDGRRRVSGSTARIGATGSPLLRTSHLNNDSMRSSGIEDLKTVLRRSAVLVVAVVLVGVLAMNAIRQMGGPSYQASARVLLNTSDLSSAALGISLPYQDPSRVDQAEQNLVDSPDLYAYAAGRGGGGAAAAQALMNTVSGTVSNNVVVFKGSAGAADDALGAVNTVASAYPSWRAQVEGRAIDAAIQQIRSREANGGKTAELDRQLQQLQVLKTLNTGETLFVDKAASATKTSPRPLRDSLLGGVIGLVIALLIVGARELFDTSVRSESDVEDCLEAPVLATIEALPRPLRDGVIGAGGGRFNDEYELLAANVAQVFHGHDGAVHLAVTSALPGEGKTTTAANLAAALSRRGSNVVLADFDLRKPAVSEFMGIPRTAAGVNDLLSGSAELRSVLWRVEPNGNGSHAGKTRRQAATASATPSRPGAEGSLMVMPAGAILTESTSRFVQLPALLDELPIESEFVIIDTPPALLVAGMAELAKSVDGVLVVVRYGHVHRRRLRALGRQTRSWQSRLIGAVFNDSPGQESSLSYYYGRP